MIAIDMRMPDSCFHCPFAMGDVMEEWLRKKPYCCIKMHKQKSIKGAIVKIYIDDRTRPDDCPLMEIKEER